MKAGPEIEAMVAEEVAASAALLPDGSKGLVVGFRVGAQEFRFVLCIEGVECLCEVLNNAVVDICAIAREQKAAVPS